MSTDSGLRKLINETPIADTHEHLLEESSRLSPADMWRLDDIGVLFTHYANDDLVSAGLTPEEYQRVFAKATPPDEKWQIIRKYWPHAKHTGYGLCVRESVRALYGEDDVTDANWEKVNEAVAAAIKPGFYREIIQGISKVDHCQVNSLEKFPFCETEMPDLLLQDLSTVSISTEPNITVMSELTGIEVRSLDDWYQVIDWTFAKYGPKAVATKNQSAYVRTLDYTDVTKEEAASYFDRQFRAHVAPGTTGWRAIQDHLHNHVIRKAVEYNLPVKLHTGYYTATGYMPLHRVGANPGDCSELCIKHPNARFVFMHTMYPYQDELIAIAKHFPNAFPDMCWSWIINPAATVRFLKEAIKAVPANKIFPFGGDHTQVELIPGHAAIARKGIAQALSELVDEGWLSKRDAEEAAVKLAHGNVRALYDIERCRANNTARERRAPGADGGA